jgi:hypothetical protein
LTVSPDWGKARYLNRRKRLGEEIRPDHDGDWMRVAGNFRLVGSTTLTGLQLKSDCDRSRTGFAHGSKPKHNDGNRTTPPTGHA